jgi:Flp pilus assembly protein TadB
VSILFTDKLEPHFKKPSNPYLWLCGAILFSFAFYVGRKEFIDGLRLFYHLKIQQTDQTIGLLNSVIVKEGQMVTNITCDFTYEANHRIFKAQEKFSLIEDKVYTTGDSVKVFYNSASPQICTVAPKSIDNLMIVIAAMLLVIATSFITFFISLMRRRSRKSQKFSVSFEGDSD